MDLLINGLKVAVIGLGVVFLALVFLVFITFLISKFSGEKKQKASLIEQPKTPDSTEDDQEIIAVITAAIFLMTQKTIVVKKITRLPGFAGANWSQAGRQETMALRKYF